MTVQVVCRLFIMVILTGWLSACSTLHDPVLQTIQHAVGIDSTQSTPALSLSPDFQYIRVVIAGRVVYLALGNIDMDMAGKPVKVWYSRTGEVLRIRDGHVVAATGMFTEWRDVTMPVLPSWSELVASGKPYTWLRRRDVMPGYAYGVKDTLVLRKILPPRQSNLQGIAANQLVWFEEDDRSKLNPLPPARFAVANGHVVYSEICLSSTLCFSWQHWPVVTFLRCV
jgi:hypothetical protein